MVKEDVCGGIVAYNPEIESFRANVKNIASQVDRLVVVDNHSANIEEIETVVQSVANAELIKNDENYGIARALNQILQFAEDNHYLWYLTMDQDSVCCSDLIEKYAGSLTAENKDVAVLCPFVLNNNKITLEEYKSMALSDVEEIHQPIDCITSASLNSVSVAKEVGGYAEELFIDCVDVEFNIRILKAGYRICRINKAYMIQSMGAAKYVPWIGLLYRLTHKNAFKKLRYTPVYNDIRLYYIARNSKYLFEKYGEAAGKRMSPSWMMKQFVYYTITYPFNRNRFKMWESIRRGQKDAEKVGTGL